MAFTREEILEEFREAQRPLYHKVYITLLARYERRKEYAREYMKEYRKRFPNKWKEADKRHTREIKLQRISYLKSNIVPLKKLFVCHVCRLAFYSEHNLNVHHYRVKHEIQRPNERVSRTGS